MKLVETHPNSFDTQNSGDFLDHLRLNFKGFWPMDHVFPFLLEFLYVFPHLNRVALVQLQIFLQVFLSGRVEHHIRNVLDQIKNKLGLEESGL
jgi:hypothetical protein